MQFVRQFTSRPLSPARLREVRREFASVLSMCEGEARAHLLTAYRTEVMPRVDWSSPVPQHPLHPAYRAAAARAHRLSEAAHKAAWDPRIPDSEAERLRDEAREAYAHLRYGFCHCDGMCECDHP